MSSIRVLLADDHPIVRDGIRNLLSDSIGIEVIGEAEDGEEAYQKVLALTPDVLLLDMELPKISGVDLTRKLLEEGVKVKILALSSYNDRGYISEMLALGASGYLIKDEVPKDILNAIRGVAQGEQGWVSREVAAILSQMAFQDQNTEDLTEREMEVLRHVVEGQTNREIAYDLEISEKTVEKHLNNIFEKLSVRSRVEAAVLAVQNKLVEPE
ncbi:MAG: response regulator transcription factor [Anaerolineales bacterium]|jgi:DNA-binding NarL/FixJ family response regulator